jgi:glycine hydroxymethyltransferase
VQKPAFETYARQVIKNARLLVRELSLLGFHVVGGGTDSHMILVDVSKLGMDGKEAEERLEKTGILANRNTIAGDTSPLRPSAIRMGTYWITARGMKESDLKSVARKIYKVLVRK